MSNLSSHTKHNKYKAAYFHTSVFDLYVAQSQIPNAGLGIFTRDTIPAKTLIDEYSGELFNTTVRGFYALEIEPNVTIDARDFPRCYMAMINDCAHLTKQYIYKKQRKIGYIPDAYYDSNNEKLVHNCEFILDTEAKKAYVHSLNEIKPNSELFIDYGDEYWK